MKIGKWIWVQLGVAFVLCMLFVGMMTGGIVSAQVEARIGVDLATAQQQLELVRDNRDLYREGNLNCSFAYQTLRNYILTENFKVEGLKDIKADISRYNDECRISPLTR